MTPAIEVRQLTKCYGALAALDTVDLQIEQGEFFALLGSNGAGKTTLISILAGLVKPTSGTAKVMGYDVQSQYQQTRKRLGVVPQELVYDPFFSVREMLIMQSGYFGIKHNDAWVDEVLFRLDLANKAHTNLRALSGGMKRRVLIAQALVHKPPVIILDEPTAGVDVDLRQSLWQFVQQLNQEGHTVVLTTHYLEEAEALCNRVAMLKRGQVVVLDNINNLVRATRDYTLLLRLSVNTLPDKLQSWAVRHDPVGGLYRISIQEYTEIETILSLLREADIQIIDLHLQQPDLEDVFVRTMEEMDRAAVP
ncbi:MAG: ABC transporter ATP-binding protein [Nitrosomonas sp.]|nr:ABC transporter ATP-binding protein [Nitrosomonas sp.]